VPLEQALEQLRTAPTFNEAAKYVEHILHEPLAEYLNRLRPASADPADPGTKAVKDAVWGMISLSHREVAVLDSPPLQRLRRIRQLGLGYLTYPTAGYSRFEHTLGAVHQADAMLRAVASRTGRVIRDGGDVTHLGEVEILKMLPVVRLAAMLHDVGHLPLSHVSERFYSRSECRDEQLIRLVADLRTDVQGSLDVKKPSLSECLSLVTIFTPCMWSFLTREGMYSHWEVNAAAGAIVGRAASTRHAFVYQLITNVIDADKLDYMFRDGFLTGVPLAVDLERLLFKLKCIELPENRMPEQLAAICTNDDDALVLGIDLAGQRLAYDVTVARAMLFERVYLHHKTRAAERVAMRRLDEFNAKPWWLLAFDDSLFTGDQPMSRTVRMLRDRALPQRAYALSYNFLPGVAVGEITEEPDVPPEEADSWRRLTHDLERAPARARLESKILLTAQRMAAALNGRATVTEVWVDTMPARGDLGTWDLWVETPDGEKSVAKTYDARAAAYAHSPAQTFFIYATGIGAVPEIGFLASEFVMATRYGLYTGRRAADGAKVPFRAVEEIKRELESAVADPYYAVARLRPMPAFLRKSGTEERLATLAIRFHHYHAQAKVQVDSKRIRDFLRQFPEDLAKEMLTLLEKVLFLDRDRLGKDFAEFLADDAEAQEQYVPLTQHAEKSANHLPYFLADGRETRLNVVTLGEALASGDPITFFDDCNISSTQSRTAVQVWFGLEPLLADEAAELASPLTEKEAEELTERRCRFRFAYGHKVGLEEFIELLSSVSMGSDVEAQHLEERSRPLAESASDELVAFLREVGEDVLTSTKGLEKPERWTNDRCAAYALGYGDCQQLVVMFYNTPTGTVTALWKSGRFRGAPWMPLFPRRGEPGVSRPPGQLPVG
jgi:HD superfamily phosphohydrolase